MLRINWLGRALCAAVVCVSLLGNTSPTAAVDVTFHDADLEDAVRDELGIPAPTSITDTDMETLGSLSAGFSGIGNLQGLEYATNLTELCLYHNQISDISAVVGLTNLINLDLSCNPLSNISAIAGLTNLTGLRLDSNQISDISAVAGITNLTYLRLDENLISDISAVAGLTNLTNLNLGGNYISDISAVAGLTNMTDLYLYSNQISDISAVAGMTNLTRLNLNMNHQISDIAAVAGMTNLTDLRLHSNLISDISAVAGLTNLTRLNLNWNQISDISAVAGLTNLTRLDLYFNQISDISAVAGLTNLTELYLGHNQISDISTIAGLTNLTKLYLDNNQIDIMNLSSADLSSLQNISIEGNLLTNVLLVDATLSQTGFNALMDGGHFSCTGIAYLPGVLSLNMSGVDFAGISDLSAMYTMDDLETLLLAGASSLDGGKVVTLTGELDSLNWLDVTGLWDSFDVAAQGSLNTWDAVPGNTLIIPEPATLSLLVIGGLAVLRRQRR